jgi:triphosphatase
LKLAARPEHLPALKRLLETRADGPGREARLVAIYFDTPDGALARQGLSLRVREQSGIFVQTVKTASGNRSGGAALARGEWEDEIAGASPDPHAPQTGRFIPAGAVDALRPLVRTDIGRHTWMLCPDPRTRIEAAVDQGHVASARGNATEPVCEIELELKTGNAAALYDIALDLLAVAPVRLERRSKSARGFRLAGLSAELAARRERLPERIKAVHASEVALDPAMTAGAALRRIVRSCADQIVGNEAAVLAGMPEGVHQMRVGVRRLRAILSAFAPLLKNDEAGRFSDELRWLGTVLGRARNLDVFGDGLVAPAIEAAGDTPGMAALHAAFAERRAAAHAEAAEAIRSPRYTALMLRLMRWSEQSGAMDQSSSAPSRPLVKIAPKILRRRIKQVRRRSAGFSKQSPEQRHRLRIALKKLRYAMEILGRLCDAEKTARLLRAAKRMQEKLGDANDLRVSHDLIGELAGGGADGKAIAAAGEAVLDWHKRRLKSNERKTRKRMAKLRDKISSW